MNTDIETLRRFLNFPLTHCDGIFDLFSSQPGSATHGSGRERVWYRRGSRPTEAGRCLLVAHADTVWDNYYRKHGDDIGAADAGANRLVEVGGIIRSAIPGWGIGADDRAGLAMLWLLRESGHSLLVTDLEERGRLGSNAVRARCPEILAEINRDHAFAIQLDRRGSRDFKCYDVGSDGFRRYVARTTGYSEPNRYSFTDICTLCDPAEDGTGMCGVNLSVGYYNEHTANESLVIAEWQHTLDLVRDWLQTPHLPLFRRRSRVYDTRSTPFHLNSITSVD